jgi:hypothetical protein
MTNKKKEVIIQPSVSDVVNIKPIKKATVVKEESDDDSPVVGEAMGAAYNSESEEEQLKSQDEI